MLEKKEGLPVRRGTGLKPQVSASTAELDHWSERREDPEATHANQATTERTGIRHKLSVRWPVFGAGLAATLVIAVSGLVVTRYTHSKEPSRIQLKGRVLQMLDQEDGLIWQFTLPGTPSALRASSCYDCPKPLIADIDGIGPKALLYSFSNLERGDADTLYCFDSHGHVRWTRQIGRELRSVGGQVYPKHYGLFWISTLHRPTPAGGIIVVGGHRGGTSLFAVEVLTKDGQVVGEYYHPGWLWAIGVMDLDKDGYDEIILGGVNDTYGNLPGFDHPMTLVVLDSRRVKGQGPTPESDQRRFLNLSSGNERAALFLRNFGQLPTDKPAEFCLFQGIYPREGRFEATAVKLGSSDIVVHYQFDSQLNLESVLPSRPLAQLLDAKVKQQPLTPSERARFYLKELGDVKTFKNE
jgi:hypothetical protein